jgi:serine/threonine protein kinase
MFDMLTGSPPFFADSKRETQRLVLHGRINLPSFLSPEAKDLLKNLLKRNHASRLGSGEEDAVEIQVLKLYQKNKVSIWLSLGKIILHYIFTHNVGNVEILNFA